MSALDIFNYAEHLYVIDLGATVKVGRSRNPERRLATHAATAAAYGRVAGERWVGPGVPDATTAETELIARCSRYAAPVCREYFPIPFETAVREAESVSYSVANEADAADLVDLIKSFITTGMANPTDVLVDLRQMTSAIASGDLSAFDFLFKRLAETKADWHYIALMNAAMAGGNSEHIQLLSDVASVMEVAQ